jgi:hypothetical protein
MGWDQAGRIVLVWPEHERILTRKLDLALLQRRCVDLGSQMALVTRDAQVIDNARQLHIPVFESTLQAQNNRWKGRRRLSLQAQRSDPSPDLEELKKAAHPELPAWISKPGVRLGFFALGVIAFLSIVAALVPGADITLQAKTQIQESDLSIFANPAIRTVQLSGEVPVYTATVSVEGRQTISTTGITQVAEKTATGYVRFTNLTELAVEVPKGTIIKTTPQTGEGVGFITTTDGNIAAGAGITFTLPVRAMKPGIEGNLPAVNLTALEGQLGLNLSVTNPMAISGGTNRSMAAPSKSDYAHLTNLLTVSLTKTALEELHRTLDPQDMAITSTLQLVKSGNTFDPASPAHLSDNPSPSEELTMSSRQEYLVLFIAAKDLRELANKVFDANLSAGLTLKQDTLQIQSISAPVMTTDRIVHCRVHASRMVQARLNKNQVINLVLARSPFAASRLLLAQMPLEMPPKIILMPSWWPQMPVMPFRINVNIN